MSQPFNRGARIDAPGEVDPKLNFWVENPWDITNAGFNLSAYERNRAYLNVGGTDFLDISYVSGADDDGDTRASMAIDFRNNGQLDLVVRQVGGGPLKIYENRFDPAHYLKVTLRGTRSNRQGIGARLTAIVAGRKIVREMYPANSFRSQLPSIAHFGLGADAKVDSLSIRWPSGEEQILTDLAGDRHIVIEEGQPPELAVETVVPGQTIRP